MAKRSIEEALKSLGFAKDLLGENQRGHFDKQRKVAQDIYGTNFDAIQTNFKQLQDRLERQRDLSNRAYNKGLSQVAERSYDRVAGQSANLVSRGLTNSGVADRLTQQDTITKGGEVANLLGSVGDNILSYSDAYRKGTDQVAEGERNLNQELANVLGQIGSQDLSNQMGYQKALAGLAGNKEARDMNNALAKARRDAQGAAIARAGSKTKEAQDLEEYYKQRAKAAIILGVNLDTGEALDMNENEKVAALNILYDASENKNFGTGGHDLLNDYAQLVKDVTERDSFDKYLNTKSKFGVAGDSIENLAKWLLGK